MFMRLVICIPDAAVTLGVSQSLTGEGKVGVFEAVLIPLRTPYLCLTA